MLANGMGWGVEVQIWLPNMVLAVKHRHIQSLMFAFPTRRDVGSGVRERLTMQCPATFNTAHEWQVNQCTALAGGGEEKNEDKEAGPHGYN